MNIDHNAQDSEGSTALMLALVHNRSKAMKLLINNKKINLTITGMKYGSALHIAILNYQYDIIDIIMDNFNINPNAVDYNGNTVLHYIFAKFDHKISYMKKLCSQLVSMKNCNLNPVNKLNQTPLLCAARNSQHEAIKFAILFNKSSKDSRRFDFESIKDSDGATMMNHLSQFSDIEIRGLVLNNTN